MNQILHEERIRQRVNELRSLGRSGLLYLRESEIPFVESLGVEVSKTNFFNANKDLVVCQIFVHSEKN